MILFLLEHEFHELNEFMSKNGKSSLTPKAKGAAMRNREKMYYKALSFGIYNKPKSIADLCHEAWAAGYFYAKQESEL